jgi:hypothetical protein
MAFPVILSIVICRCFGDLFPYSKGKKRITNLHFNLFALHMLSLCIYLVFPYFGDDLYSANTHDYRIPGKLPWQAARSTKDIFSFIPRADDSLWSQ